MEAAQRPPVGPGRSRGGVPGGHIVFVLYVILSFAKNFNLGYNFWMVSIRVFIHEYSSWQDLILGIEILTLWRSPSCLTYLLKILTLTLSFWSVATRALTFHMSIPYDRTFPCMTGHFLGYTKIDIVSLNLEFDLLVKNFDLGYILNGIY
jgi:hypothetical protein